MQRTIHSGVLALIMATILLGAGCNHETSAPEERTVQATLEIQCSQFSEQERSVKPTDAELEISSYHVTATGPAVSTAIDLTAETSPITLGNIAIGTWSITVEALNPNGKVLATGSTTQRFSPATTTATLSLETLPGEGEVSLQFSWPTDQVSTDAYLLFTLTDQKGNAVEIDAGEITNNGNGTGKLVKTLAAGSYVFSTRLISDTVSVSGSTIAIRVVDGTTSSGTIALVIGDMSNSFSLSVTNNTSLPVQGTVTCQPTPPKGNEPFTLQFSPSNLAKAGLTTSDLIYQWYCEGIAISGATSSSLTVSSPIAGTHRYDLIISASKLGSVGSVSTLVSVPVSDTVN